MKKLWFKIKCWLNFHTQGYPQGFDNVGFHGFRVDFYTCKHCGEIVHKSVKVDY